MALTEIRYRRYFPWVLLFISLVALFLFIASYFVEIRIIIDEPRYGDVTGLVQTFWRAVLGITTIGSFLIGVYTLISDENDSEGLTTKVEIKGTGHDIDVYPNEPVGRRDDGTNGEAETESDDETPSVDADDSGGANTTGEKPTN